MADTPAAKILKPKEKPKKVEKMGAEPETEEELLERSVEEIRTKMKEKRRKKVQADLSLSRSRLNHKNANLILKTSLRLNNRNLAKSLEVARNENRQAQQAYIEVQRERHLLQSIVNRYQEQHTKQRNQIMGVRELLNKVTSNLLDTVGLLGEALDMCVMPRQSKDSSLGLVFRNSSVNSDDLSDVERKETRRPATPPARVPLSKKPETSDPAADPTTRPSTAQDIPDLADLDIPLMFDADEIPAEKGRGRREAGKISLSHINTRRTSSIIDPATIAAVASEVGKSVDMIKDVMEESRLACSEGDHLKSRISGENGLGENHTDEKHLKNLVDDGIVGVDDTGSASLRRGNRRSIRGSTEQSRMRHKEDEEDDAADDDGIGNVKPRRRTRQGSRKQYKEDVDGDVADDEDVENGRSKRGSKKRSRMKGKENKDEKEQRRERRDAKSLDVDIPEDLGEEISGGDGKISIGGLQNEEREEEIAEAEMIEELDLEEPVIERPTSRRGSKKRSQKESKKKRKSKSKSSVRQQDDNANNDVIDEDLHDVDVDMVDEQEAMDVGQKDEGKDLRGDILKPAERDDGEERQQRDVTPYHEERIDEPNKQQLENSDKIGEKSDYHVTDMDMTNSGLGHISVVEQSHLEKTLRDKKDDSVKYIQVTSVGGEESKKDVGGSQQAGSDIEKSKESKKSKLPVMRKDKVKKSSKLQRVSSKAHSKTGSKETSKMEDKDVLQTNVFDLSLGDSFSHPTPPCFGKSKAKARVPQDLPSDNTAKGIQVSKDIPAEGTVGEVYVGKEVRVDEVNCKSPDQDMPLKIQPSKPVVVSSDDDAASHNGDKPSKIKRKARKSKTVVTPGHKDVRVQLSKKALLEELNNLDASYLADVTNYERRSKIESALPVRKSSLKGERESLSDLITKPVVHKSSKRKLSKKQSFLFGHDSSEDEQTMPQSDRKFVSEPEKASLSKPKKSSDLHARLRISEDGLSVADTDGEDECTAKAPSDDINKVSKPASLTLTQKSVPKDLNVTHDVIEDIDNVMQETEEPVEPQTIQESDTLVKPKAVQRQTTILKKKPRKEPLDLNVTFDLDDDHLQDNAGESSPEVFPLPASKMPKKVDRRGTFVVQKPKQKSGKNVDSLKAASEDVIGIGRAVNKVTNVKKAKSVQQAERGKQKSEKDAQKSEKIVEKSENDAQKLEKDVRKSQKGVQNLEPPVAENGHAKDQESSKEPAGEHECWLTDNLELDFVDSPIRRVSVVLKKLNKTEKRRSSKKRYADEDDDDIIVEGQQPSKMPKRDKESQDMDHDIENLELSRKKRDSLPLIENDTHQDYPKKQEKRSLEKPVVSKDRKGKQMSETGLTEKKHKDSSVGRKSEEVVSKKAGDGEEQKGPSKTGKEETEVVEEGPKQTEEEEVPSRRARRGKAVSYKEPSLNSKLRQGDPNTETIYKQVPTTKSRKSDQKRPALNNITNKERESTEIAEIIVIE